MLLNKTISDCVANSYVDNYSCSNLITTRVIVHMPPEDASENVLQIQRQTICDQLIVAVLGRISGVIIYVS
jgi:hypothetical protein